MSYINCIDLICSVYYSQLNDDIIEIHISNKGFSTTVLGLLTFHNCPFAVFLPGFYIK